MTDASEPKQLPPVEKPKPTHLAVPYETALACFDAVGDAPSKFLKAAKATLMLAQAGNMDNLVKQADGTYAKHEG